MIIALSHHEWQLLRVIVRVEKEKRVPTGRELRVSMSRKTKDGSFLDDLVSRGLISVAAKAQPLVAGASQKERSEPEQFRARYKLTDKGRHAAEYGECEVEFTPGEAKLTGTAAELFAAQTMGKRKK